MAADMLLLAIIFYFVRSLSIGFDLIVSGNIWHDPQGKCMLNTFSMTNTCNTDIRHEHSMCTQKMFNSFIGLRLFWFRSIFFLFGNWPGKCGRIQNKNKNPTSRLCIRSSSPFLYKASVYSNLVQNDGTFIIWTQAFNTLTDPFVLLYFCVYTTLN